MSRFALAMAAVLILTLSAGFTDGQSRVHPAGSSGTIFQANTDSFRSELLLVQREQLPPLAHQSSDQEPPAPALLVYLGLILVGSAVSVLLARRQLLREI